MALAKTRSVFLGTASTESGKENYKWPEVEHKGLVEFGSAALAMKERVSARSGRPVAEVRRLLGHNPFEGSSDPVGFHIASGSGGGDGNGAIFERPGAKATWRASVCGSK